MLKNMVWSRNKEEKSPDCGINKALLFYLLSFPRTV